MDRGGGGGARKGLDRHFEGSQRPQDVLEESIEAWHTITCKPEDYRGKEAVQGHWKGLNADSQNFAGIFNRLHGPGWRSGLNDEDIISQALSDFRAQGQTEGRSGKPFKYLRCWEKLRGCAKWTGAPPFRSPDEPAHPGLQKSRRHRRRQIRAHQTHPLMLVTSSRTTRLI